MTHDTLEDVGVPLADGREGIWMETYTGSRFHLFNPDPSEFHIEDVARHLANQCRYNGATRKFFSVAQHSVMGSFIAEEDYGVEMARTFLLHDGIEYVIGDMIRPLKRGIPTHEEIQPRLRANFEFMVADLSAGDLDLVMQAFDVTMLDLRTNMPTFAEVERSLWTHMAKRFDLPEVMPKEIKEVDNFMLAWEKRDLRPHSPNKWPGLPEVDDLWPEIYPEGPERAYRSFVARFQDLFPDYEAEFDLF